jgi:hypothetical protein
MPFLKDVPHQTTIFSQEHSTVIASHYAGGVLTPMLHNGQRIVNELVDPLMRDDPDNAAHSLFASSFD